MLRMFTTDEAKSVGPRKLFANKGEGVNDKEEPEKRETKNETPLLQEEGISIIAAPTIELSEDIPIYSNTITHSPFKKEDLDIDSSLHTVLSQSLDLCARLHVNNNEDLDDEDDLSFAASDVHFDSLDNIDATVSSVPSKEGVKSNDERSIATSGTKASAIDDTGPKEDTSSITTDDDAMDLFSPMKKVKVAGSAPVAKIETKDFRISFLAKVAMVLLTSMLLWAKFAIPNNIGGVIRTFGQVNLMKLPLSHNSGTNSGQNARESVATGSIQQDNTTIFTAQPVRILMPAEEIILEEDYTIPMVVVSSILLFLCSRLVYLGSRLMLHVKHVKPCFEKRVPSTPKVEKSLVDFDLSNYGLLKMEVLRQQLRLRKCSSEGKKDKLISRLAYVRAAELETRTVVELRRKLKSFGLKQTGKKRDLIKRLVEHAL